MSLSDKWPIIVPVILFPILIVMSCAHASASSFIADGYTCSLEECTYIAGTTEIYVSGGEGDSFTLKVDGKTLHPNEDCKPEIRFLYQGGDGVEGRDIKTDATSNAANKISINNKLLGRFPSDGSIGVGIRTSRVKSGENAVTVIIGGFFGDGPYDEKKPHGQGSGNQGKTKDDFLLSNVHFVLPNGQKVIPDGFVSYKAKAVGSTEKVIQRYKPYPFKEDEKFWVGDGWGSYDTWAGNTTDKTIINSVDKGRYDIPYKVDFLLNYEKPDSEAIFELDTKTYKDGPHMFEVFVGENCVFRKELIIDNSWPVVTTNIKMQQNIENGFILEATFGDEVSGLKTHLARLEGQEIGNTPNLKTKLANLKPGVHSLIFEASDIAGNTIYQSFYFNVVENAIPDYRISTTEDGSFSLLADSQKRYQVVFYEANPLEYTSYYGTFDGLKTQSKRTFDILGTVLGVTTKAVSALPYHAFEVDVHGVKTPNIKLSYQGETLEGERLALKAFNQKTLTWDTLATGMGKVNLLAEVDLDSYAKEGRLRVMAVTDYITNGSDTLLWITDPQHYTKFSDLNKFYDQMHQYAADEYLKGNIGYLINTGDLVDDAPSSLLAPNQWEIADKAINYAENMGVPSGVVTGNHDTGNFPSMDYSLFFQYFGADRYRTKPYYGGSLNNNACHYDLVTIGNHDLVVLYLGYGVEGTPETIAWANQILKRYSHRNAIICTHQYLSATTGGYDTNSRAKEIYNEIVLPNENVKLVLCGHNHGSIKLEKKIANRVVYEILSDYQFIQLMPYSYYNGNRHYQGSVPDCNGEGYLRSMTFFGNLVKTKTFSPVTGGKNPFGMRDEFDITLDFQPPKRQLTTYAFAAVEVGREIETATIEGGKDYQSRYTGSAKALVAAISTSSSTVFTAPLQFNLAKPQNPKILLTPADLYNLEVLVTEAKALDSLDYLKDSWANLESSLRAAEIILISSNPSEDRIAKAYHDLFVAKTALQPKGETILDPDDLQVLYEYHLDLDNWVNSNGPVNLNANGSYLLATKTESGLIIEKTSNAPNGWPQMKYNSSPVTITPADGKIYLYLDIDASSPWVLYPIVKQNRRTANFRLNYVIEGLGNIESDGGPGVFKGVFDITEAFKKYRFDLTQPLEITMMINAVPGPVAIKRLAIMTKK